MLAEILARARRRLEAQALYPRPLRKRVPVVVWPWFFRLPPYRRYVAYELAGMIVLSATPEELVARRGERWLEDLLVHELCHIWQLQHRPVEMTLALLRHRYETNPFEVEARNAARATDPGSLPADGPTN
jgi:hypothetical protein